MVKVALTESCQHQGRRNESTDTEPEAVATGSSWDDRLVNLNSDPVATASGSVFVRW